MARGEDTGSHPNRQVSRFRVTAPGEQAFGVPAHYGAFERRLMAAQEAAPPAVPDQGQQGTRLDDNYSTLGQFTSKHGRVEDRAISLRTYRNANLRRSITADPISRRKGMRQRSGGELEGYS